ncbi:cytochrome o ubiquinol oxidase subunit IV [Brevibacillus fulvus]|uniref:Cytochrome o ubiquinol oxidase operon protein cyoD n=1 Tax=Brevibacillus fulvus TaxID=1125967 RepID=A0A938XYT9_9BACL|nr:cytochrome o ubiquinol oxidase subunit IV [Brevibacillus fulvus]MBM7590321.1 cytochrome o ubiquinol oxidase operon protein cyoD [Brevibacillus fulvus]
MSQHEAHGSVKAYVIGFLLSIVLTIIPLLLVLNHMLSKGWLVFAIMLMAVLQFIIQLVFFMHIREGEGPKYNVMALILGIVIVFTIVAGSMWIMSFNG